jgi:hypothetical protein
MADKRCTFKCGDWNCGSYQFNLYKADIDQGDLCDVHYWQTKAQREWVGLTDEEIKGLWTSRVSWTNNNFARAVEHLLKGKNT